jgi:pyrimidine-specific ribonucleoside hydrolase
VKKTLVFSLLAAALVSPLGSLAQSKIPAWIDTDPSVARGGHEVDDGFALIRAFHSPELEVRGVSVVFGNAPLQTAWPIGKEIVEKFGPKGLEAYKGAAGAEDLGTETEASEALERALRNEQLTILAIGPVTNLATVLKLHPELAKNVVRIVAVAGRRPGQRFVARSGNPQAFRDFNFELDPVGFQVLLDSHVPIVLTPWELSSKVWMKQEDLDLLDKGGPDAKYLVPPARDWLEWWHKNLGTEGFNPFDTLAVGYLTSPDLIECFDSEARIEMAPDDVNRDAATRTKPYLLVSSDFKSGRPVTYCYNTSSARFKEDLLRRLLGKPIQ